MRLAIDIREACRPQKTGKGQWTYGFVAALLERRDVEVMLVTDTQVPAAWIERARGVCIERAQGLRWHRRIAADLRKKPLCDVYVSPTSYLVPALLGSSFPCIPIVHDLIAFRREPHERRAQWIERLTLRRALRHARQVCTISDATKHDVLKRYPSLSPDRVTAVYAGPMVMDPPRGVADGKTILCIATLCPRKNQERLVRAFASLPETLRSKHQLILAGGRGWQDAEIVRLASSTPHVEWRSYVHDTEYQRLIGSATVFALPSLYEGFGMQILDALHRGVPVLTSDRGSLREVVGGAACMVDPESIPSIARGLETLLTDAQYRHRLALEGPKQASHFSWKRTTDLFLTMLAKEFRL